MGRTKSKQKHAPFVAIPWEMLNSEAYYDLKPNSAKALVYFLGKYGKEHGIAYTKAGANNFAGKTIEFTYSEAKRLGFALRTFSRIIEDLIEKGFIEMAEHGGLQGFCKSKNKFLLSARWERYGQKDFVEVSRYPSEMS